MTKNIRHKIENRVVNEEGYNSDRIFDEGRELWGQVFDMLGVNYENPKKSLEVRTKFVDWAKDTLAVCPCLESIRGENNSYYIKIIETEILPKLHFNNP